MPVSVRLHPAALVFSVVALGLTAASAVADEARAPIPPADVPAALALPPDEQPVLKLQAKGTQNYECRPGKESPQRYEWVFVAPEAELFDASGKKVGTHYAGPTWESTQDGSKVAAAVKAKADAPDPAAVPWLLLGATSTSGKGAFALTRSVQRIDTHGGQPPAGECKPGEVRKVPYTATYYFSRAKR
jgi:hypothetical protein